MGAFRRNNPPAHLAGLSTQYPRWQDVTTNPAGREALAFRSQRLQAAHKAPCNDRADYLVNLVRGKRVLDIGVVDHHIDRAGLEHSLHLRLHGSAESTVGIDVMAEGVTTLQSIGLDVRHVSVLDPSLPDITGTDFDVVVAGELIEHIEEPGMLFVNARSVLRPGGRLILTTPNPYCLRLIAANLRGLVTENVDHIVYYFPSGIAELADRHGWTLETYRGARDASSQRTARRRIASLASRLFTADATCWTYIYELVPS